MRSLRPLANPPLPWLITPEESREIKALYMALGVLPEWLIDPEKAPWPPNHQWGCKLCTPAEHLAVKAVLGIPAECPTWEVYVVNPPRWHGYHFDLFGTLATADDPPEAPRFWLYRYDFDTYRIPTPGDPPEPPGDVLAILDLAQRDKNVLLAWRRRVFYMGVSPYLEARWTPTTGETLAIHGLEKDPSRKSVDQVDRGRKLLRSLKAVGGRPPDMEEAAFRSMYWDAYQKVLVSGRRPTKTEVAAELLIPTKTLKRNRDRYNLPWPPLPPQ